jgi:hypothetical protein
MSSQLKSSPSTKSLRSRMGTIMKRSSTALTGGFARPPTPARSSTDSLRLDANSSGPEHVMPSPVAESPAREAAESMPEPTGPSKLSGPPIAAPDPTPQPTATPEPAPAVAPAPRSDAVPVPLPSAALPRSSSPEPMPAKAADAAPLISHSPETLSRAESERPDDALQVRRSEDSGSTRSHGQVERQLPTEIHAAPWDSGPLVAERSSQLEQEAIAAPKATSSHPNPVFIDRASTPPLATEAPSVRVDNVSNAGTTIPWQNNPPSFDQASAEVASLMLKSRTRGSSVSSQVRPRTPSIFNGRVSRRPSVSTLASSAAALSGQLVQTASMEPRQEGAGAVPASSQCVRSYAKMMPGHDTIL